MVFVVLWYLDLRRNTGTDCQFSLVSIIVDATTHKYLMVNGFGRLLALRVRVSNRLENTCISV